MWLDKIKNALIEEDPTAKKPAATPPPNPQPQGGYQPGPVQSAPQTYVGSPTPLAFNNMQENPKIVEHLSGLIKTKALEGHDYLKFLDSQKALASIITDPMQRMQAAYQTGKAWGFTKRKLLDTAQFYLTVLQDEHKSFLASLQDKSKNEIDAGVERSEHLGSQVELKQKQIESLRAEIESLNKERSEIKAKVDDWRDKLKVRSEEFELVYTRMSKDIEADIQKINGLAE